MKTTHTKGPWIAADEHHPNYESYKVTNETEIVCHGLTAKNKNLVESAPEILEALSKLYFSVYGGNSVSLEDAINRACKSDQFEIEIVNVLKKAFGIKKP